MKKYFLNNGEEIKFGDIINATKDEGYKTTIMTCIFDEDSIDFLKELGIVIEKDTENSNTDTKSSNTKENNIKYNIKNNINNNIKNSKEEKANNKTINKYGSVEYYYNKILNYVANKIDGTASDALIYLACLEEINPIAALNIYLKEISYELNSKYVTSSIASSIKNLKDVYIISAYTGHVIALINTNRKALKYLAWFKNKEDAEFARNCVISLIERIFGKDDQSKD